MNDTVQVKDWTAVQWRQCGLSGYRTQINPNMVKKKNLNQEQVGEVFKYNGQILFILSEATTFLHLLSEAKIIDKLDQLKLEEFKSRLQELEFQEQEAWGFDRNKNYHIQWMDLPGCDCPRAINRKNLGKDEIVYSNSCPWHGWFKDKTRI